MRPAIGKGHYKAFLPPKTLRMSVFRSSGIGPGEVEAIGRAIVSETVKGHATVTVAAVTRQELRVQPAPAPHPRHADIVGWSGVEEEDRSAAMALADSSVLTKYTGG
jgi:hypothetical protein